MQYLTFSSVEKRTYTLCILVNALRKDEIEKAYITPFGLNPEDVLVIKLHQLHNGAGRGRKTPVGEMKRWINEELAEVLKDCEIQYLLVTDAEYFKVLTGKPKTEKFLGYMLPSPFGSFQCGYAPSYERIFYDPDRITRQIETAFSAVRSHAEGTYLDPGCDILEFEEYPQTVPKIAQWLQALLDQDVPLTCDIEAFSLKHYSAGIGTISFAWNQGEGIAFPVDLLPRSADRKKVRKLLRRFFMKFTNKLIFHKIDYDVTVLIYQLFMSDLLDQKGLLRGLKVMLRNWDCTRLISYLATNSCAGNKLGLKDQAQEFAGNYAEDEIKDIRKIPLPNLLRYNLVDTVSTWYVHNKHYPTIIEDNQKEIYENIFKPAMLDIVQMQLTGMPVDMAEVKKAKAELTVICDDALDRIMKNPVVEAFSYQRREDWVVWKNETLKVKRVTLADCPADVQFNPRSGPQLAKLLFEIIDLPVLDYTQNKEPKTGSKTLQALHRLLEDIEGEPFPFPLVHIKDLLLALVDFKLVDKILGTFIPAMEEAQQGSDGWHYMFGNFNLGGTLSGRLSSSDPNLQNLPANGLYAKIIKRCFKAPPGWHFCGIDFASLEDRISALTTKDPNKLKVYTDGYDGHAMRAVAYWPEKMPDIDPNDVASVNSIAEKGHKYGPLRQRSKNPTFAMTYQGTINTLVNRNGFSREEATKVFENYQKLYAVSVAWVNQKLDEAMANGYIIAAFGLRVRTPLLKQVIRGTKKTPYEAEAEGRSAGNALGQSWCLLNSRAGSEFMGKVRDNQYRLSIKPCAQIHDAQYFLIRDDMDVLTYANEHIVEAVEWQDHPDIWHPDVHLGGEFSIFWPDWSAEMVIPNHATPDQFKEAVEKHLAKLNK